VVKRQKDGMDCKMLNVKNDVGYFTAGSRVTSDLWIFVVTITVAVANAALTTGRGLKEVKGGIRRNDEWNSEWCLNPSKAIHQ